MQSQFRVVLMVVLAGAGCSKDHPEAQPRPEPSLAPQPSAATAVPRASSVSPERSSPPNGKYDYEVFRGALGRAYGLKRAALICEEPCRFPEETKQRVWLVRDGRAEPADQYWPRAVWGRYTSAMQQAKLQTRVTFFGDYPQELYAWGAVESRSGDGNLPLVKWSSDAWQRDHREFPSTRWTLPPREYDAALLSAPVDFNPLFSFAYGADAPPMTSKGGLLAIHTGKAWDTRPAPWAGAVQLTRLADGSTLALNRGAWLVSSKGEITALRIEKSLAEKSVTIAGDAWILGSYTLSRPSVPGRFKVAQLPLRTSRGRPPTQPGKIANPSGFDRRCKTPAVLIEHTDGTPLYGTELPSLFAEVPGEGAGLEAYVADFELGERSVVQAQDLAAAERVLDALKSHPDLRGELTCSDLRSLLPDPYARTEHLRRVFIHARSGVVLELT